MHEKDTGPEAQSEPSQTYMVSFIAERVKRSSL